MPTPEVQSKFNASKGRVVQARQGEVECPQHSQKKPLALATSNASGPPRMIASCCLLKSSPVASLLSQSCFIPPAIVCLKDLSTGGVSLLPWWWLTQIDAATMHAVKAQRQMMRKHDMCLACECPELSFLKPRSCSGLAPSALSQRVVHRASCPC